MRLAATLIGGLVAIVSLCALLGWWFDISALRRIAPHAPAMKPNTAACLGLLSVAVIIASNARNAVGRRLRAGLCAVAIAVAGATLLEYVLNATFGIDGLLARGDAAGAHPGRMSIAAAAILLLLAIALAADGVAVVLSQTFAAAALAASILATLTYIYRPDALGGVAGFSSMAAQTASSFVALSIAVLLLAPSRDPRQLLASAGVGGTMARRLLPAVLIVPPIVGWARLRGQAAGAYGTEFGVALFAVANMVSFGALVYWNASMLNASDARRRRLEREQDDLLALERAARERAEEASQAKDQLLSVVSHELRTPLTPVALLVRSMQADPGLPARLHDDMNVIREQIDIEVRLINDLLDLASLSAARLSLTRIPVDLAKLTRDVAATMALPARQAGIEIELEAPRPAWVSGDPVRLGQVLRNLIDNAIKFSPRAGAIRVGVWADDQNVLVEVSDHGIGMSAAQLSRIFEPFEQADSSTTRRYGGLGIGLTIARRLVSAHGGKLEATSRGPEQGTTFRVTFTSIPPPLTTPLYTSPSLTPALKPQPASPPASRRAGTRVLLVEDNPRTLAALGRVLAGAGLKISQATSAAEALAAARDQPFDVVICDIGLPDTDGWELFPLLRKLQPIVGIALSGFVTDDDRIRSAEAGFALHLDKPADVDALLRAIDQLAPTQTPPRPHPAEPSKTIN
jgi:signal transduction histidine kinase/CheY-like chemotaxis protein